MTARQDKIQLSLSGICGRAAHALHVLLKSLSASRPRSARTQPDLAASGLLAHRACAWAACRRSQHLRKQARSPAQRVRAMVANGVTNETFLFTSESVNEGHPDKLCDQVPIQAFSPPSEPQLWRIL